jgi:hypothetical protein
MVVEAVAMEAEATEAVATEEGEATMEAEAMEEEATEEEEATTGAGAAATVEEGAGACLLGRSGPLYAPVPSM